MRQFHSGRNLSIDLILDQLRRACAILLVALFGLTAVSHAQRRLRLSKIEFVGLKRLTAEQVIATSELEIGQFVDPNTLDAAAQKLMDSGLFKKLSYNVHPTGDQAILTFHVEEAIRRIRVSFDNFVWFDEGEIYVAIRRDIPFFDGTVPEGGDGAGKIAALLEHLLNEKKISGRVEFMPFGDESGKQEILFRVKGAKVPICTFSFPGAAAISEEELTRSARDLIQTDYSKSDVGSFTAHTLLPLYHHLGYLRAQFESPQAAIQAAATEACKEGVAVTIPVAEGLPYSWDKAEWSGNQALSAAQLSAALGMKAGEAADDRKLARARQSLAREYANKGYMTPGFKESVSFDDAAKLVTYHFAVTEGPQFRMGDLTINGLSDEDARRLKQLWQLAPGSIFDQSYLDEFMTKAVRDFLGGHPVFSGVPLKFGAETKPDRNTKTVNVIITFK